MLRWTQRGAVAAPTTVQIRVGPTFPGRVRAGAPVPPRAMEPDEVEANVRYFAVERAGPRTRGCDAVVLSGVATEHAAPLGAAMDRARTWGVQRLTLHLASHGRLDIARSALGQQADTIVLSVSGPDDLDDIAQIVQDGSSAVHAVVVLDRSTVPGLAQLATGLVERGPQQVVFTWPFTDEYEAAPPPATDLAEPLRNALSALARAGVPCGVKGLPLCALGPAWAPHVWKSRNRWYVDQAHQRSDALVFFPDVVRFAKPDSCRFCAANPQCDGVVDAWLARGLAGSLDPIRDR